eukprot:TRINITY_DN16701_c0_g6_i1.p1 TRINITY_DN16701_c0_g6~~TRINITY_DN16701_c0_g6_i1.p1  ORF type:complete len:509 (+),score=176.46 TRINITY_DN16701_c0_g6_i1:101-1528(+)
MAEKRPSPLQRELLAEREFADEKVHVQKTSMGEAAMLERMAEEAAARGGAAPSPDAPDKERVSAAEKAFADEKVHVQKTSMGEAAMLERMAAEAAAKGGAADEHPTPPPGFDITSPSHAALPARNTPFDDVVVGGGIRQKASAFTPLSPGASSMHPPAGGGAGMSLDDVTVPAAMKPRAKPALASSAVRRTGSGLGPNRNIRVGVAKKPAPKPAPASPPQEGDPAKALVFEEPEPGQSPADLAAKAAADALLQTKPAERGEGAAAFGKVKPWELERELTRHPATLKLLAESLYQYYEYDAVQMVHGLLEALPPTATAGGAVRSHVEKDPAGFASKITVETRRSTLDAPAKPAAHRSLRAGYPPRETGNLRPAAPAKQDPAKSHAAALQAAVESQRLTRLRTAFARIDTACRGHVTPKQVAAALEDDPTVRRLVATCYGAPPAFARKLQDLMRRHPQQQGGLALRDFEALTAAIAP